MNNRLIITGASRGIGAATATRFIDQGWQVINISRTPCSLSSVTNISVDLLAPTWVEAIEQPLFEAIATSDKICLVHNAASCINDSVTQLPAQQLRDVLELNVVVPNQLNQLVLPSMKPGSSIIYIGSTLAEKAVPNNASYITSKHALAGLMKATCQDLDNSGIHTCCICPGLTETTMLRQRVNEDEKILDLFRQMSSFKRLIDPKEISAFILFCAQNPVINGAMLHANLGQIER